MIALLILVVIILLIVFLSNANKKNKMQMAQMNKPADVNYHDELLKIVTLKEKGAITEEEFEMAKTKIGRVQISDLRTLNLARDRNEISQAEYLKLLKTYSK